MRYGIISDVHSNIEAFHAVTNAMSRERIDEYIFLGDLVGYGADPHACIAAMRLLRPKIMIAGNHDWGILGLLSPGYFNDAAAAAILWTKAELDTKEFDYLRSFKLFYEEREFTLTHGSLNKPARFNYIFTADDACITMRLSRTPLCFVGHTHSTGIFCMDKGEVSASKDYRVKIDPDKRYLINAGSVGQPRDGDSRASYAIYDNRTSTVEIKRTEYDLKTAQDKIIKAGLPDWLAYRLSEGR